MVGEAFEDLTIPAELEESLRRHREHLAALVASLRSAGLRPTEIEESVSIIIASYRAELIRALERIAG